MHLTEGYVPKQEAPHFSAGRFTIIFVIFLYLLFFLAVSASAVPLDLNLFFTDANNGIFLNIITRTGNINIDVNLLQVDLNSMLFTKEDFFSERVGEYSLEIDPLKLREYKKISVFIEYDENILFKEYDLNVIIDEKIEVRVQELLLNKSNTNIILAWLEKKIYSFDFNGEQYTILNSYVVSAIIFLVIAILVKLNK